MCYDISVYVSPERLGEELSNLDLFVTDTEVFETHYHISAHRSASPHIPVITASKPEKIQSFLWGLLPPWMKEYDDSWRRKMANAKAETLLEKRSYKSSALKRHCVILATGFFEWRHIDGKAYPYFIRLKGQELFGIAGIWEYNRNLDMPSVSLITTEANPMMAKIHNKKERMPVILDSEGIKKWIGVNPSKDASPKDLEDLFYQQAEALFPFDEKKMEAHTVSKLITSRRDNPDQKAVLEPEVYYEVQKADGEI